MADDMKILAKLEKLRSLKSQMALVELQRAEARIRQQIATLNEHRRQSHATDSGLVPMRTIGADVMWQAWIDRTQKDLNIDLARVLARKEPVTKRAKVDVARKETATELSDANDRVLRAQKTSKQLEAVLQMATVTEAIRRQT